VQGHTRKHQSPLLERAKKFFPLAVPPLRADNDAVRMQARVLLLAITAFCAPLAGAVQSAQPRMHPAPPPEARIDINHARLDELMKVPGMTQTWAARIVRFRPYRTKEDLVEKGVLTSQVYDRIKDYVIAHREKQ
jgi:competence protein ComEA